MGNGRRYDQDYKDMIVDLFKSGMSVSEISSEYGIAKSTINGWIKEENEILHQRWALAKKAMAIFATRN